jgi:hypothetical protein
MHILPDTPLASPTPSRPVSSGSSAVDDLPGHQRIAAGYTESGGAKRTSRSKTSYVCARPARPIDSKLHLRPKVLLQLHQLIPSQRPKPTYELVPFSLLPPRSTRRLAQTFNTRERLGPHDLLVVKAQAYGSADEETPPDDDWASSEVVGVISPAKGDKSTEICMDDGSSRWEVTDMPNGGFEFSTTDDHGLMLKARWVLKPAHSRRVSSMSASSPLTSTFPSGQDDKKYTFSTISLNSRRHPIIATMTRSRIDVMDSYTMPSAASPHTPALTPASDVESFISNEQVPITTDDALRRLILVTGSWIASQSSNTVQSSSHSTETSSILRTCNSRSSSPTSTIDDNRRTLPRLLRTGRERLPRSTSFTESSPTPVSLQGTMNTSPKQIKTRSRRANSTGTANLSTSGSMRKRYGLAFEGEALPETEEERLVKRSIELLRIKELALPPTIERLSSETTVIAVPPRIVIPTPSETSPAPLLSPPLLSPPTPDPERSRKAQSAYEPVKTAGLWDSGVTERPGLKSRPTSMSVILEKKKKQDRKQSKDKLKVDASDYGSLKKRGSLAKFKSSLKSLFRREKP